MHAPPHQLDPPNRASARRRGLAAAISSVTVFGIAIGISAPLLSILLETRGTDATLNGLNAASTFIGVILGPLLTPRALRRFGIRPLLLFCLALDVSFFLLLKLFDSIGAWFVLRMGLGLVGSSIFTASEAWISLLAGDAGRGRILGLYAAALSAGFGTGPLLLSLTGIAGWTPFIATGVIIAIAALPLIFFGDGAHELGRERGGNPFAAFARAPFIMLAAGLFGLYETAAQSLLPVWGLRIGLGDQLAAATLTAIYLGAIALQVPIGWLSDRVSRRAALSLCGLAGLAGAALLPAVAGHLPPLFLLLFIWGGLASGIYPVALSIAGERFRGADLVGANAALIVSYGLGSLMGPVLGGAAMDLSNPQGLPILLAAAFALLLAMTIGALAGRTTPKN